MYPGTYAQNIQYSIIRTVLYRESVGTYYSTYCTGYQDIQYSAIQYRTVNIAVQYRTVQYSTVQYITQCNTVHSVHWTSTVHNTWEHRWLISHPGPGRAFSTIPKIKFI